MTPPMDQWYRGLARVLKSPSNPQTAQRRRKSWKRALLFSVPNYGMHQTPRSSIPWCLGKNQGKNTPKTPRIFFAPLDPSKNPRKQRKAAENTRNTKDFPWLVRDAEMTIKIIFERSSQKGGRQGVRKEGRQGTHLEILLSG